MQIQDTLEQIAKINKRNSEKVENAKKALNDIMFEYLGKPTLIAKIIKNQATQKDLFGETTLTYFEEYDAFILM